MPAKAKRIDRRTDGQRPQLSVRDGTRRCVTKLDTRHRLHLLLTGAPNTPNQGKFIKSVDLICHILYNVTFLIMLYIIHCRIELLMRPHFTND